VPLRVVSYDCVPDLSYQIARADHAVRAGLSTVDRRLIVAGSTEYWPSAFSLDVWPGLYVRPSSRSSSQVCAVSKGMIDTNCISGQ
jgi:hypothetical protein